MNKQKVASVGTSKPPAWKQVMNTDFSLPHKPDDVVGYDKTGKRISVAEHEKERRKILGKQLP